MITGVMPAPGCTAGCGCSKGTTLLAREPGATAANVPDMETAGCGEV